MRKLDGERTSSGAAGMSTRRSSKGDVQLGKASCQHVISLWLTVSSVRCLILIRKISLSAVSWNGTSRNGASSARFWMVSFFLLDKRVWSVWSSTLMLMWCRLKMSVLRQVKEQLKKDDKKTVWSRCTKTGVGATISISYLSAGRECVLPVMIFLLLYYSYT